MRTLILYLLVFLTSFPALAQKGHKATLYTSEDGLPSSHISRVFQDSRDFLWMATNAGLSKYDGHRFTNYSQLDGLGGSHIMSVAEDWKGDMWFGTTAGLYQYNGKTFKRMSELLDAREILPVKDTIWVVSRKGLHAYNRLNGAERHFTEKQGLLNANASCLLQLRTGELLIGTSKGVSCYRNGRITPYWSPATPDYVMDMAEDQNGNVWVSTLGNQVFYSKNGQITSPKRSLMHANPPVRFIVTKSGNVIVVYTKYLEVYRNGELQQHMTGADPTTNAMYDGIQDREGNFWFATLQGLMALRQTFMRELSTNLTEDTRLFYIERDTTVYYSNCQDLYRVEHDTLIKVFNKHPTMLGCPEVFGKTGNSYWLATRFGDVRQYKDGVYKQLEGIPIWSSSQIGDQFWCGGSNGMVLFEGDSMRIFPLPEEPAYTIKFAGIGRLPGRNHLLVSSQRGTFEFNNGKFRKIKVQGVEDNLMIEDLDLLKDNIYLLATRGYGLVVTRWQGDSLAMIKTINSRNGLGNDFIKEMIIDDGVVWLMAFNGVYKITDVLGNMHIDFVSQEDGMPANGGVHNSMVMNRWGEIYVAGTPSIVWFPKDVKLRSSLAPRTYITNITVGNQAFNWQVNDSMLSFHGIPRRYRFKPGQNSFHFTFTGISLYKPSQVKYEYKLENFDDAYFINKTTSIGYNDLPPGDYVFKVRSTINEFFSNEPYSTFTFTVGTPFWMTWWFRIALVLSTAAFIYSFYRWRLREQMNKEKMKLSMERELSESKILAFQARMNPHFIFNSLNAIQYFMMNNDKLATLNYVSKFGKLLRQILDNTLDAKVNLEKEIELLRSYIEIEELRFENKFSYTIKVADELHPSEVEIPGMIIQPFVENSIIHGLLHKPDKGTLCISFTTNGKQVICAVQDNGVGRKASATLNRQKTSTHQSHGTAIAMNRLQLLSDPENGLENKVTFIDLEENESPAGTRVIIEIPII